MRALLHRFLLFLYPSSDTEPARVSLKYSDRNALKAEVGRNARMHDVDFFILIISRFPMRLVDVFAAMIV